MGTKSSQLLWVPRNSACFERRCWKHTEPFYNNDFDRRPFRHRYEGDIFLKDSQESSRQQSNVHIKMRRSSVRSRLCVVSTEVKISELIFSHQKNITSASIQQSSNSDSDFFQHDPLVSTILHPSQSFPMSPNIFFPLHFSSGISYLVLVRVGIAENYFLIHRSFQF